MLAGRCRNVIIASVKQGEVKKQERAVLYLADYPHASSRLQGERADSLNRQEQAEHRPHYTLFAETHTHYTHTLKLTEHKVLSLSITHTHKQEFKQGNKRLRDFQTIQIGNTVDKHISKGMQRNIWQGNSTHRRF